MGRVSAVQACFLASMIGLISAQNPFNCPFTDHYCTPSGITPMELNVTRPEAEQVCYEMCYNKKDDQDEPCKGFTVTQFGKRTDCYLLTEDCDRNTVDNCFEKGRCMSGPADCTAEPTGCPALAAADNDNVAYWVCTDEMGDRISDSSNPMPLGAICSQSCPSWRSEANATVVVESRCESPGAWSKPRNIDNSTVTYPSELRKPDEPPLDCGCQSLEIRWNHPDGLPYDPNDEEGTDFICMVPLEKDAEGVISIEPSNYCKLFCDDHYVATVQCLDGEWTGNPEWGFWCYTEPPTSETYF